MAEDWLDDVAGADPLKRAALLARLAAGEPQAYVAGFLRFRGQRYAIDPRAYVTDPELSHLVDVVLQVGDALAAQLGRAPVVLDFGVGAGTLAISLLLERPQWILHGLDVDPAALELAAENAAAHAVPLHLHHSDLLRGWPVDQAPPDLIFGDPPWGSEADLYADAERDAAYYHRMPAASAYPRGGRTAIHDALIAELLERAWPSTLVLNYGVLPEAVMAQSAARLPQWQRLDAAPGLSVLVGRVR